MLNIGFFTGFNRPVPTADSTDEDLTQWQTGAYHIEVAQKLERACVDFMLFEDLSAVSDAYGGSMEADLALGATSPKHDPVLLLAALSRETSQIGLIATLSTSLYPPFLLARSLSTLDHLTAGRVGWNIVTSADDRAAQNYGQDSLPGHDERYERAEDYVDLVKRLWTSWEPDAVVNDRAGGVYVDHNKVHVINHEGPYYRSRGPLNTLPPLRGQPVLCQAGGSPRGRQFAAAHGELIVAAPRGITAMKAFRADMRARAAAAGRDPDSVRVLFLVCPVVGETEDEANQLAAARWTPTKQTVDFNLLGLSSATGIDFSTFDREAPVPADLTTNGHLSSLLEFVKMGNGEQSLANVAAAWTSGSECVPFVGTGASVARQMEEVMEEVGGDGFLLAGAGLCHHRGFVSSMTDLLIPALQERGLMRKAYDSPMLRDNLFAASGRI